MTHVTDRRPQNTKENDMESNRQRSTRQTQTVLDKQPDANDE